VAVGYGSETIFSPDSGKHWIENLPLANSDDLCCVSSQNGVVLSGSFFGSWGNSGYIFKTTDQGDVWKTQWLKKNIDILGCDTKGWTLVGEGGAIYHSPDKGLTWDSIRSGTKFNLNAVHFINIARGYAVGDHGTILLTTDAGYTWVQQHCPTKQNLRSVHMSDPIHGFICGDSGVILTTQNGGYYDEDVDPLPESATDIRNYPNPFSSRTTIEISIPYRGHVRLSIYNMLGEEIATLANGIFDSGLKTFEWNAGDAPSGIYICKLEIHGSVVSSQITLEK
jgi:photosystem II stability/assembly factor-like uncharacterized protein